MRQTEASYEMVHTNEASLYKQADEQGDTDCILLPQVDLDAPACP